MEKQSFSNEDYTSETSIRNKSFNNALPETNYLQLINSMHEGLWIIDTEGITTFVNPRMAQILGYTENEMIHVSMYSFLPEENHAFQKEMFERRTQGIAEQFELQYRRKDGVLVELLFEASPIYDSAGNFKGSLRCVSDITDRKRDEEQIRIHEEQLQMVFDQTTVGMVMTSPTGIILQVNQCLSDLLGYSVEELLQINWRTITHPDDLELSNKVIQQCLDGESKNFSVEKRYIKKNGEILWTLVNSTLIRDHNNIPLFFNTMVNDITQRKQTENLYKKIQAVYDQDLIGVVITTLEGQFLQTNRHFCNMLGYSEEELLHKTLFDITVPSFNSSSEQFLNQLMTGELPFFTLEKQYERKDKAIIWGKVFSTIIRDQDGNPDYYMAFVENITESKKADEQIRINEEQLQLMFDQMTIGIAIVSPSGAYLRTNQAFCDMLGYSAEEIQQIDFRFITYPEDLEISNNLVQQCLNGEIKEFSVEKRYIKKNGEILWALINSVLIRDINNNPSFFSSIVNDITKQKQAENVYKKIQAVYDQNIIGVSITSPEGLFLQVNHHYCNMMGYSEEELLQMTLYEITEPSFIAISEKSLNELLQREKTFFTLEKQFTRKDGLIIWGRVSCTLIFDKEGNPDYYIAFVEDITFQKCAINDLEEAKTAAIDANQAKTTFLSIMSHEVRNPLTSIIGYSEMLSKGLLGPLNVDEFDATKNILKSSRYLSELTSDMFDISLIESGQLILNMEWISIKEIIAFIREMFLEKATQQAIEIICDLPENIADIWCDEKRVKQILINLLSNAIKYTPDGGQIKVFVENTEDLILISVKDTGVGIAKASQAKLFEPFQRFETGLNKVIEGTGLGLYFSKHLVELLGGQIWVKSELGKGSTFTFSLPKMDQQ